MNGKSHFGLTTDKWLWLTARRQFVPLPLQGSICPIQPFYAFIDRNYHQPHICPNLGIVESHTILSTFQMKKAGYVATIGYVLQGSVLNATCFPISNRGTAAPQMKMPRYANTGAFQIDTIRIMICNLRQNQYITVLYKMHSFLRKD